MLQEGENKTRSLLANIYVQALGVYVGAQSLALVILALLAAWHDTELLGHLTAWDAKWYLAIAEYGYDGVPEGEQTDARGNFTPGITPLGFFPLYPTLVSLLANVPGIGVTAAALAVSASAGLVAACGITRLAQFVDGRRPVALILVALWAGAPMAIVFSMPYTEALFTALAVWALIGVLERNWALAAASCAFAGWARPTASVLIAVVVIAALIAAWRGRDRWEALICAVCAPLGLLTYWGHVALATGRLDGWMWIEQTGWNTGFDAGAAKLEFVARTLAEGSSVMEVVAVLTLFGGIVLLIHLIRQRVPWQLAAYAGGVLALIATSSTLPMGTARFVLPAMCVLLLPLARHLAARRATAMVTGIGAWVLLGAWYSAYALAAWPFAI